MKRALFHFPKVSSKFDEWIEFGSERIARLNTKAPPLLSKHVGEKPTKKLKLSDTTELQTSEERIDCKTSKKVPVPLCPKDEKNFVEGGK